MSADDSSTCTSPFIEIILPALVDQLGATRISEVAASTAAVGVASADPPPGAPPSPPSPRPPPPQMDFAPPPKSAAALGGGGSPRVSAAPDLLPPPISSILSRLLAAPPLALADGTTQLQGQNFVGLHSSLLDSHMEGTRMWALKRVFNWLSLRGGAPSSSSQQLFCVLGSAGTGKSVLSAKLLQELAKRQAEKDAPFVVGGVHFCRHDDIAASRPSALLSSLAAQLAAALPAFGERLDENVDAVAAAMSEGDPEKMFEELLAAPLRAVFESRRGGPDVILLLDALDELPYQTLQAILNLLSRCFALLPPSVRLFVTSRELPSVSKALAVFKPLELRVDEFHNRQDMRKFMSSVAADCVELSMTILDVEARVMKNWPGLDVAGKLVALEEPLTSSKRCYDVAAERISKEPFFGRVREIEELRPHPTLEQDSVGEGLDLDQTLAVLAATAEEARGIIKSLFATDWRPMDQKPNMLVPVSGSTRPWVENAIDPGVKGLERARQKAENDYGGNALLLKDLARISLEFTSCGTLYAGYEELKKCPGVEIVSVKNKFANPTPMGYRDLNLGVRITLPDGRRHICEVQINLIDMLEAKHEAHKEYEIVRERLPAFCKSAGGDVNADDVEKFIMKLLESSVLDSAVKDLEDKAGGLFVYARLLKAQLKVMQRETSGRKVDFSKLGTLPQGLGEMYDSNFKRTFAEDGSWELCKRIVTLISVAREPLPETLIEKIVGEKEYSDAKTAMSLLFPAREGRLHVMHKSVVDWLTEGGREGLRFWIGAEDKSKANAILAKQLWIYEGWKSCGVDDSWEYEMEEGEKYAVSYGHVHFKDASSGGEGKAVVWLWHDALLKRRNETPLEQARERGTDRVAYHATAAGGILVMRQAATGRIRQFTIELRELEAELKEGGTSCEKTLQLRRLIEDKVAVLGSRFNPAFREIEKTCFAGAASAMFSNVPITSPLNHSAAATAMCFLKPGTFAYQTTLPNRVSNSPIIMELQGHSSWVTSVAFSNDGLRIVSGSEDKTGKIWNAVTGAVESTLKGHFSRVTSVAFSFDGSRVVSGSNDKTVKIWSAATGEVEITLIGHSKDVFSVAFSFDGSRVVSGSNDKTVKIWNAVTGAVETTLKGHSLAVTTVTFNSDGSRIVSGSNDKTIKIWNSATGEVVNSIKGHTSRVTSLAFSNDGTRIVYGSEDNTVKIWNAATGDVEKVFSGHSSRVSSVAFSRDGSRIVSGSDDYSVKTWNTATGAVENTLQGHSDSVTSVAFSSEGSLIVSGSDDYSVKIWRAATGEVENAPQGHSAVVTSVAFSRDGLRIASGSWDSTVKIWNAATGDVEFTLQGHSDTATSVAFNSDRSRIASGGWDMTVKIWNAETGELEKSLQGHTDTVTSVAFSFDGSRIVSGSNDSTVKIWNAATGEVESTLQGHSSYVTSVAFSDDGLRVVSGSNDKTAKVWNVKTGDVENTLDAHSSYVTSVAFSSDGSRIVTGSWDSTVKIWNAATCEVENTLDGHSRDVTSVAFSFDGSRVVSGSNDKTLKIWNAATGELENTLRGHSSDVTSVAFNDDGLRVVSGSSDNTLKIWNATTRRSLAMPRSPP